MDMVTLGREMQVVNRDRMAADVGWTWTQVGMSTWVLHRLGGHGGTVSAGGKQK